MKVTRNLIIHAGIVFLLVFWIVGCTSGSNKAQIEPELTAPIEVKGSDNDITNTQLSQIITKQITSQVGEIKGDVEKIETNTSNGIPSWMFIIGGLLFGFLIPQPLFVRMFF